LARPFESSGGALHGSGQIGVVAELAAVEHPLELDGEGHQARDSAYACDQSAFRRSGARRSITPDSPAELGVYSI
jgi:hypothetical protein